MNHIGARYNVPSDFSFLALSSFGTPDQEMHYRREGTEKQHKEKNKNKKNKKNKKKKALSLSLALG